MNDFFQYCLHVSLKITSHIEQGWTFPGTSGDFQCSIVVVLGSVRQYFPLRMSCVRLQATWPEITSAVSSCSLSLCLYCSICHWFSSQTADRSQEIHMSFYIFECVLSGETGNRECAKINLKYTHSDMWWYTYLFIWAACGPSDPHKNTIFTIYRLVKIHLNKITKTKIIIEILFIEKKCQTGILIMNCSDLSLFCSNLRAYFKWRLSVILLIVCNCRQQPLK